MIDVHDVRKDYGDVRALQGVSFSIATGDIVGLLGPNGAGKTTMMKILTGYLMPTAGQATVGGVDVTEDRLAVQRQIGYLPENAPLYLEMPVQDYLVYIARLRGVPESGRLEALRQAVVRTGLQEMITRPIGTLSKGYRQRVGLAQAIIHGPRLLILDEPTNGLDPTQIVEIRNLIKDLARESTVILSSHILSEVQLTCERVVMINRGQLVLDKHLDSLGAGVSVIVEVASDTTGVDTALKALPGVDVVRRTGGQGGYTRWTVEAVEEPGMPLNRRIFQLAAEKNWPLQELRREAQDLESVFQQLVIEGVPA